MSRGGNGLLPPCICNILVRTIRSGPESRWTSALTLVLYPPDPLEDEVCIGTKE